MTELARLPGDSMSAFCTDPAETVNGREPIPDEILTRQPVGCSVEKVRASASFGEDIRLERVDQGYRPLGVRSVVVSRSRVLARAAGPQW
jgi:hypothetical protein